MNVARTWVFPILRIVLVAVVAVALVKLAFFPDRQAEDGGSANPTGTVAEPEVAVVRGSIANDLVLSGTVDADAPVAAKATGSGTVDEIFVAQGAAVVAGEVLYDIKVQNEVEPVEAAGPDGVPVVTVPKTTYRYEQVVAPIAGVVSVLDVLPGQSVAIGDARASVAPPTFSVTAAVSPEQQYRLTDAPAQATVEIAGGPAPFTCGGLVITASGGAGGSVGTSGADGGAGTGAPTAGAGGGSGATVRCTVPSDVRVFPGLTAAVTVSAGVADGVLVVPTTAVEGGAETGTVWVVQPDGERVEAAVRLGLTDGALVEVVEGLAEGDTVLQFVPGAPAVPPGMEGCDTMPDGMIICAGSAAGSMG
ncbi:efflux RND transporter periplasmic adaptor subunit [Agromyces sp. LHK192]|uniref:efflux RND transporter periplasmic adaptor subunit n=1 Tax=Agromyces sp. LHK192 TaxID=2498704 RepID=UPI00196B2DE2|nr:hypothetical protein [Agromyces sp. LHK192]